MPVSSAGLSGMMQTKPDESRAVADVVSVPPACPDMGSADMLDRPAVNSKDQEENIAP